MIIYTTNVSLFALPLLLALWLVDSYLLLVAIRLVLGRFRGEASVRVCRALQQFTDPPHQALCRRLNRRRTIPIQPWMGWAIIFTATIIIRQLLAWIILSTA